MGRRHCIARHCIALTAALSLTAVVASAGNPVLILPDCNLIGPDFVEYVPQTFSGPLLIPSQTGNYGYRPGCGYFLTDVKLAQYSNTEPYFGPQPLQFTAGPYDLPSSSATGGTISADAEDCARLTSYVQIFEKPSEASKFTLLCEYSETGSWSAATSTCAPSTTLIGGTCPSSLAPPAPNSTDWRTYRIGVRTMERTSSQETGLWLSAPVLTR
jgi:hypothetical protein